jgi:hypothetical protein
VETADVSDVHTSHTIMEMIMPNKKTGLLVVLIMEAMKISEESGNLYHSPRCKFSEDIDSHNRHHDNLKSHKNTGKKYESTLDLKGR